MGSPPSVARQRGIEARLQIVGWRDEDYVRTLWDLAERLDVTDCVEWREPVMHPQAVAPRRHES